MSKPVSIFSKTTKPNTLSQLQVEEIVQVALMEDLREGDVTTDHLPELSEKSTTAIVHAAPRSRLP